MRSEQTATIVGIADMFDRSFKPHKPTTKLLTSTTGRPFAIAFVEYFSKYGAARWYHAFELADLGRIADHLSVGALAELAAINKWSRAALQAQAKKQPAAARAIGHALELL